MRIVICRLPSRWPWLLLLGLMTALGWYLYVLLPPQPRWRVVLDEPYDSRALTRTNWDLARGSVYFRSRSGFETGPAMVLDIANGRELARFDVPDHSCGEDSHFSPCGRFGAVTYAGFVTNPERTSVRWLNFVRGTQELQDLGCSYYCTLRKLFSPSGEYFALILIPESRDDYRLTVFRTGTRKKLLDVPLADFSRDLEPFVPGEENLILFPEGPNLVIWDLEARQEVGRVPNADWPVRFSPDGLTLSAWSGPNGAVSLWNIRDRSRPKRLADSTGESRDDGHFSPDGVWWARRCPGGFGIVHVPTGHLTRVPAEKLDVSFFFFSPDSRRMGYVTTVDAWFGQGIFHCTDPATGRILWNRPIRQSKHDGDYREPLCDPLFSADSQFVILPGLDATSDVVRMESGELAAQVPAIWERWPLPAVPEPGGKAIFLLRGGEVDNRDPHDSLAWLPAWIKELLHLGVEGPHEPVTLLDLGDGVSMTSWQVPVGSHLSLAPDGRSLLVASPLDPESCTLTCWDIPRRRPWEWIIGVPAGIGVSVLASKGLRRRKFVPVRAQGTAQLPSGG